MLGAAVTILIMAWANVVTLAIVRVMRKTREFATRLALGASRRRLVWSLMLENMMLSLAAGAIAWWIARAIVAAYGAVQFPNTIFRVWDYTLDGAAMASLFVVTLASGTAAGLITAAQCLSLNGHEPLRASTRGATASSRHRRLYEGLVSGAVAMTMVLLVAAAALTRSFLSVYSADVGLDTANVISMSLYAPPERYPDAPSRLAFYEAVSRRLRAVPGMKSVAFANAAPGDDTRKVPFEIAGMSIANDASAPVVGVMTVAAGYFQDLDAPVLQGREFAITDTDSAEPVIVVNDRFARQHWPRSTAIGEHLRLSLGQTPGPWLRVVGVAGNIVQNDRTRQSFEPLVYIPHAQNPIANLFAMGRTSAAPETFAVAINKALHAVDPNLAVPGLWSLQERFNRIYGVERNVTILFAGFAIVAVMVAASGLYCIVSRAVQQRSREIAIRSAMGATTADISRLVLRQAMYPTGAGMMLGLAASISVHRLLGSELISVRAVDPVSTVFATALLVLVATIASAMPMLRAARIPPAEVLAQE
jgi:putative ABC transport system permease protein